IFRRKGWSACLNVTGRFVNSSEPPGADPHARWCVRGRGLAAPFYSIWKPRRRIDNLLSNDRHEVNEASGGNIFKGVDPDLVWESKKQNKRSLVAQGFSGLQVMERVM